MTLTTNYSYDDCFASYDTRSLDAWSSSNLPLQITEEGFV